MSVLHGTVNLDFSGAVRGVPNTLVSLGRCLSDLVSLHRPRRRGGDYKCEPVKQIKGTVDTCAI